MLLEGKHCFTVFGISLGLFGICFGLTWKYCFYKMLLKIFVIRPNSLIFDLWQIPSKTIDIDFYMFNWTNPEELRNPNVKPKFQELGPYHFFERQDKTNFVWHASNGTVSYRRRSTYKFDVKESAGSLTDIITTVNSLGVAVSTLAKGFNTIKRRFVELSTLIYPRHLTIQKKVGELLFSGYTDTILTANKFISTGIDVPFNKYGYCYGRNATETYFGAYNVFTGDNNINNMGKVNAWNYKNYSGSIPNQCSQIHGSAGEFYGPNMPKDTIKMFIREICRDIPLDFESETYLDGIRGFKYIASDRAIDNGTLYPENACLCNGECLPSGVINTTECWYGSPIFTSYPHFYKADPIYLQQIDGLSPDKEKHEFSYIIEPETGIGLNIIARTQVNQLIRPIHNSRLLEDVPQIMFPLFWAEVRLRLSSDLLDYFRLIDLTILFGQIFGGICFFVGIILVLRNHLRIKRMNDIPLKELKNQRYNLLFLNRYKNEKTQSNYEKSMKGKLTEPDPLLS